VKGGSNRGNRFLFVLFVASFLFLQSWKTPAPFFNPVYFQLTFFVRTNAAGGFIVTRTFNVNSGPLDNQRFFTGVRVVPSGVDKEWLGIEGNNVIRVRGEGEATIEAAQVDLNNMPVALTLDTARNRALAATIAGDGFLYQRRTTDPWALIAPMGGVHLAGMTYYPPEDVVWGLRAYQNSPTAPVVLTKYSATGEKIADFTTNGFPVNVAPDGYSCEMTYFLGWGENVVMLLAKPYNGTPTADETSRIYIFQPRSGNFFLACEKTYGPRPPAIQFAYPSSANAFLTPGAQIIFGVEASDPDADLQKVELLDNGSHLKDWTFDSQIYGKTNGVEWPWTAAGEGRHTITARATDATGAITETSVTVDVGKVRVERVFPGTRVMAGQTISVSLTAQPAAGIPPWTIKERPPADWTISPQNQGTLDPSTHEITCGPFNDSVQRTLTYLVTAPVSSSLSNFAGNVSVNGSSTPIVGPSSLEHVAPRNPTVEFLYNLGGQSELLPGTPLGIYIKASDADGDLHWAEIRCDGALLERWDIAPLWYYQDVQYSTAWFPTVPGQHTFTAHVEDLLGNIADKSTTLDVVFRSGVYVSRNLPTNVIAGQSFTVRLDALPGGADPTWFIKEKPPTGWQVRSGADASIDPNTHEITWGPFDDPRIQRKFTYDVTAPVGATKGVFNGQVWINGAATPIANRDTTHVLPPTESSVQWIDSTHVIIHFNAFPGIFFIVESADSVNSTTWTQIETVLGRDEPIQVGPIEVPAVQKFFRLRPN
jgi:hypothetical protein